MLGSKWCVLLSNLVGEANEKVLINNKICINYFVYTGSLLEYEVLDADNLIKLQGICSKNTVPVT